MDEKKNKGELISLIEHQQRRQDSIKYESETDFVRESLAELEIEMERHFPETDETDPVVQLHGRLLTALAHGMLTVGEWDKSSLLAFFSERLDRALDSRKISLN